MTKNEEQYARLLNLRLSQIVMNDEVIYIENTKYTNKNSNEGRGKNCQKYAGTGKREK